MASSKTVNKRTLAAMLGVTERTLTHWQAEGLPFIAGTGRGKSNFYAVPQVIAWMVAREVAKAGAESGRDRVARLQGDLLEIELAAKHGTLIPAAEIEPAWTSLVVAARQALLAMPARAAPLLVNLADADQAREILDEQVRDALTKLAADDEPGPAGGTTARASALGAAVADPAVAVGGGKP